MVPMLAVPLLLGGVTAGEFGRMALVIVDTLFFSLTLGICVSAMSRSARKAVLATVLMLLLFALFFPALLCMAGLFGPAQARHGGTAAAQPRVRLCGGVRRALQDPREVILGGLSGCPRPGVGFPDNRQRGWRPARGRTTRQPPEARAGTNTGGCGVLARRASAGRFGAGCWMKTPISGWPRGPGCGPSYVWAALGMVAGVGPGAWPATSREWLNPFIYFLTCGFLNLLIKLWVGGRGGPATGRRPPGRHARAAPVHSVERARDSAGPIPGLAAPEFLGPVAVTLAAFLVFLPATLPRRHPGRGVARVVHLRFMSRR